MNKKVLTMKFGLLAAGKKIQTKINNDNLERQYQKYGSCSIKLWGQIVIGAICGLIMGSIMGSLFASFT